MVLADLGMMTVKGGGLGCLGIGKGEITERLGARYVDRRRVQPYPQGGDNQQGGQRHEGDRPRGGDEQRIEAAGKGKVPMDSLTQDMEIALNQSTGKGKKFEVGESSVVSINEEKMTAEIAAQGESNQGSSNMGNPNVNLRGKNEKEEKKSFDILTGK
jgi:hypothetical protein